MDKMLIFGDSLVYGKWDSEGGWAARLRKYVDEKYNLGKTGAFLVYAQGIPADLATLTASRLENELVERINPNDKNLVILAIGVNDSCPNNLKRGKQTPEADFKKALRQMIDTVKKYNCQPLFIGLTPVNPAKSKGLQFTNEEVKIYDQYFSEVCKIDKVPKLDLFED